MLDRNRVFAVFAAAALAAAPAAATVISGTVDFGTSHAAGGTFITIGNPAGLSVGEDNFNDDNMRAFNEVQGFTLLSALKLDNSPAIAAGTRVSSHFVVFDPAKFRSIGGTVTFDRPILGVIFRSRQLASSDFLANPLVTYLNPGSRGFEFGDILGISGNTVSFDIKAKTPGDSFRVITAAVPEPATWGMLMVGFGMVGFAARRRNRSVSVTA
jgi:hypothetical protein